MIESNIEPVPEVLERVNRARQRLGIGADKCPCAVTETGRGCVGPVCMQEILSQGRCKCGAYKLKEVEHVPVQGSSI